MDNKINIFGITKKDLENYFESINEKKFKATQVYEWLYEKKESNPDNWSNIKKEIRDKIKSDFSFNEIELVKEENTEDASKYLFKLSDNEYVESVLMRHDYGNSVCVSSEIGCNMACSFCESGRLKKVRGLHAYEIVEQILKIEELIKERVSSVVVMGIGEPFDNFDEVMNFIKIINDPKGLAIGARHITVSTCGIIPKIKEFSSIPLQVNLAISLHAPTNELRNKLMPINKAYSLDMLIPAIKEYIDKTNRRVTIEYLLLQNVNDTDKCAHDLAKLIRRLNVYVNLIPYNETSHIEYKRSPKKNVDNFYNILVNEKINVTVRRPFGRQISAACGQLRSKEQ